MLRVILIYYACINIITFVTYGWDKLAAKQSVWRTQERTSHLLALIGGAPGALIARHVFRHKTRKSAFTVIAWLALIVHVLCWGAWLYLRHRSDG